MKPRPPANKGSVAAMPPLGFEPPPKGEKKGTQTTVMIGLLGRLKKEKAAWPICEAILV
jgi:hypothetical protein